MAAQLKFENMVFTNVFKEICNDRVDLLCGSVYGFLEFIIYFTGYLHCIEPIFYYS